MKTLVCVIQTLLHFVWVYFINYIRIKFYQMGGIDKSRYLVICREGWKKVKIEVTNLNDSIEGICWRYPLLLLYLLFFSLFLGKPRYAETWDFHVSASTFLQFELSMGCSKPYSNSHSVHLQYSLNNGRDWHLVTEECVPPTIGCQQYTESSIYTSERFQNWKRVTVYLPPSTKWVLLFWLFSMTKVLLI